MPKAKLIQGMVRVNSVKQIKMDQFWLSEHLGLNTNTFHKEGVNISLNNNIIYAAESVLYSHCLLDSAWFSALNVLLY